MEHLLSVKSWNNEQQVLDMHSVRPRFKFKCCLIHTWKAETEVHVHKRQREHMDVRRPRTKKHFTFHHSEHSHFLLRLKTWTSAISKKLLSTPQVKTSGAIPWQSKSVGPNKHKWQELWTVKRMEGGGRDEKGKDGGSVWKMNGDRSWKHAMYLCKGDKRTVTRSRGFILPRQSQHGVICFENQGPQDSLCFIICQKHS